MMRLLLAITLSGLAACVTELGRSCDSDLDCTAETRCHLDLGYCVPRCGFTHDESDGVCEFDYTCRMRSPTDPVGICRPGRGRGTAGQACSVVDDCTHGHICTTGGCAPLCSLDRGCLLPGACVAFEGIPAGYGLCIR